MSDTVNTKPARKRGIELKLRVTEQESKLIATRMKQAGIINREAYLRKMAIDGYVVRLDLSELKEITSLLRRSSNNLNQLAKRVNATGCVYDADMQHLHKQMDEMWEAVKAAMRRISEIE